jgi:hypothetical protein
MSHLTSDNRNIVPSGDKASQLLCVWSMQLTVYQPMNSLVPPQEEKASAPVTSTAQRECPCDLPLSTPYVPSARYQL